LFQCTLKLPNNCPIDNIITSDWKKSASEAKTSVCFETCKQLHQANELSDNLLPIKDYISTNLIEEEYYDETPLATRRDKKFDKSNPLKDYDCPYSALDFPSEIPMDCSQVQYKAFKLKVREEKALSMSIHLLFEADMDFDKINLQFTDPILSQVDCEYIGYVTINEKQREEALKFTYLMFETIQRPIPEEGQKLLKYLFWQPEEPDNDSESSAMLNDLPVFRDSFNRFFIVHGASIKMNDPFPEDYKKFFPFETYIEYFQSVVKNGTVDEDEEAMLCIITPSLTTKEPAEPDFNVAMKSKNKLRKFLSHIQLTKRLVLFQLPLSAFYLSYYLFRYIFALDERLMIYKMKLKFGLNKVDDELLKEALTLPYNTAKNYQRLEILGDAVLKWVVTLYLFLKNDASEAVLSKFRYRLVRNKHLTAVAVKNSLYESFIHRQFSPTSYNPPGYKTPEKRFETKTFNDKCMADVLEAVLGAIYLSSNYQVDQCITFLTRVGAIKEVKFFNLDKYYKSPFNDLRTVKKFIPRLEVLNTILNRVGSKVNHPSVYLEALTHVSDLKNNFKSFQRLEFVGDALIDLFVTKYLFLNNPNTAPGLISPARATIVNFFVLGRFAYELKLPRIVIHFNQVIPKAVEKYYQNNSNLFGRIDSFSGPELWLELMKDRHHPPKLFSDLFESFMAAMLIDNNLNYELVESFLNQILTKVYEKFGKPEEFIGRMPKQIVYEHISMNGCLSLYEWSMAIQGTRCYIHKKHAFNTNQKQPIEEPPAEFLEILERRGIESEMFYNDEGFSMSETTDYYCAIAVHRHVIGFGSGVVNSEAVQIAYVESLEGMKTFKEGSGCICQIKSG
jgi:dsRNA-specific ribonuclease